LATSVAGAKPLEMPTEGSMLWLSFPTAIYGFSRSWSSPSHLT